MYFYDTTPLTLIWHASWILSLASLILLVGLLIVRHRRDNNATRYERRYSELQDLLVIHLENPLSQLQTTFVRSRYDVEILANLAQKVIRSVGGSGRQHILSFIELIKMSGWIYSRTLKGSMHDRLAAIQLIGDLPPSPRYTKLLRVVLQKENDQQLLYVTAESLSKHGNIDAFEDVLKALEKMPHLSSVLIYDIFQRFDSDACDRLASVARQKEYSYNVRLAAIRALGDIALPKSHEVLMEQCFSFENEVCAQAYGSLAKTGMTIPQHIISHGVDHSYWKVRMHLAEGADNAENFPVEELEQLLADDNWLVSICAARALYSFGSAGQRILEMIAQHETNVGRRAAAFMAERETKRYAMAS